MTEYFARGGISSGGRSSISSSRSSSSSRSTSTSRTSTKPSTSTRTTTKSTAKPGSTIKTSSGKTVKSSSVKPSNIKNARSTGVVGDNGYTPHFYGYSAPAGSVVYYQQHSALDYLPWIYLFSQNSPRDDKATIVQPDNKQVTAEPAKGVDGLYLFNWFLLIVMLAALIVGIVYFINKKTSKGTLHEAY